MMPTQITSAGGAVDFIETARPWMTLVPWPVTEDLAIPHRAEIGAGVISVITISAPVMASPTVPQTNSGLPVND